MTTTHSPHPWECIRTSTPSVHESNPDIAFLARTRRGAHERAFSDASADCDGRGLWAPTHRLQGMAQIHPDENPSLNDGLRTLQFQSLFLDANAPEKNLLAARRTTARGRSAEGRDHGSIGGR